LLIGLFVISLAISGCSTPASANPDDYVGEYVLRPNSIAPGQFASFVILKKDHTAVEITFVRETDQVITTETKWSLSDRNGEYVAIADFSHPVEGSPSKIKLGINDDLGQYYEKIR
jgi:hypothetical protein